MNIRKQGRHTARRVSVGVVTSAVVTGMLLVVNPAPAGAATTVNVGAEDIRGDESTYAGWHQGYANASESAAATSSGLMMSGKSQVINGYLDNAATGITGSGMNADLASVLPSTEYDVTAGSAYFQVPMFIDDDNNAATAPVFTTLRPADPSTGDTSVSTGDDWVSSKAVVGLDAGTPYELSHILAELQGIKYKTLAFGVLTTEGSSATVSSITWDGTTYQFVAGTPQTTDVQNADVRRFETAATYTSWHQGYDNATAAQQVTADGLVLAGKSQVLKGYANNTDALNAVNANLRWTLPDASYTVAAGSAPVFFQVAVKFDNGDGVKFATLRNSGAGAGTNTFAFGDQWQSSKPVGAIPANTDAPLGDLIDALGHYKTIGFGVLTNAGTAATVSNITFANRSYDFAEPETAPGTTSVLRARDIRADESTYAGWHQGAAGGTITADPDSTELNLGATRSQLLNGYPNNSNDLDSPNGVNLVTALTGASYTVVSGPVHFQVALFAADPDSGQTKFATLRPAAPAVPGLNRVDVGQEWISSKAIGTIAANTPMLLGDLLSQIPSAKVIGYGVYQDNGGNGKISDITFDGVRTTFTGNRTPASAAVSGSTTSGHAVTLALKGNDADGDPITYSVGTPAKGTAAVTGGSVKFTAPVGYVGTTSFSYTATDDLGAAKAGTVTVKVGQVRSALSLRVTKGAAKKTFFTVRVSAPGAVVDGGRVDVKRLGKVVASGKVVNGKVRLLVGKKLPKGSKYYGIYFRGTTSATAKSVLLKVRIR
ncbi:hypothetical protein EFK50_19495 [Nocardioides marmoriginsengisoli]|uniref:Cadherin-like domain-containing protein n=1 Tax=Nocardioides marmoriginsengisoli TaxID=661483 RepID=A0A3N0CAL2_9ACTN|nr:Ig-like domain-containing protein [Nocardioides marmoriginsengisoli]RNL60508.1 hypothetical protein EFK50_19495 [Nocardioides marmoriginsengisoli]